MFTDTDVSRPRRGREHAAGGFRPRSRFGLGTPTRLNLALLAPRPGQPCPTTASPGCPRAPTRSPGRTTRAWRLPSSPSNFYGLTTRDYEKTKTDVATADLRPRLQPQLTLRNQFRYGRNDRDSVITAPRFVNASFAHPVHPDQPPAPVAGHDGHDRLQPDEPSSRASPPGAPQHALVTGLDFGREDSINYLRTGPHRSPRRPLRPRPRRRRTRDPSPARGPSTTAQATHIRALRLRHRAARTRSSSLTGGLRYDHFEVDYDHEGRDRAW